jgi:hypothetical protein
MSKSKEGDQPHQIAQQETKPQGGPERQPQQGVLDIMGRRAQLNESIWVRYSKGQKYSRKEAYAFNKQDKEAKMQLDDEVASLYPNWTDRDQLIFDLYTASEDLRGGLTLQETRAFIAKVQSPQMSEDGLREEMRKVQEAQERKAAIAKKISETQRSHQGLDSLERWKLYKENEAKRNKSEEYREYQRNYRQKRKEQRKLEAEKQQPTQVFPDPTKSSTP